MDMQWEVPTNISFVDDEMKMPSVNTVDLLRTPHYAKARQ